MLSLQILPVIALTFLMSTPCSAMDSWHGLPATETTLEIVHGTCAVPGTRRKNEDRYFPSSFDLQCVPALKQIFFGVYDGHGGDGCSQYAAQNLHKEIFKYLYASPLEVEAAFIAGYEKCDVDYCAFEERADGTTAATALFLGNMLWIANVGDSEIIGCFDKKTATCLTTKHTAQEEGEYRRVLEHADATITFYEEKHIHFEQHGEERLSMNRIPYTFGVAPKINFLQSYTATQNEQETTKTIKETAHISRKNSSYELAVSRALGNRDLKPICSAMPAVQSYAMSAPGFIILASDGLWDGMSHQAAVDIVLHKFMESGKNFESFEQQDVQKIAQSLVEHGKTYFSSDDITVTIVFFRPS